MWRMSESEIPDEEVKVLFHASKLGRTDIVQHAVSKLKEKESKDELSVVSSTRSVKEVKEVISMPSSEGITPLHVAAFNGHADVVRALLVSEFNDSLPSSPPLSSLLPLLPLSLHLSSLPPATKSLIISLLPRAICSNKYTWKACMAEWLATSYGVL